jgi:3-deoxy-D-manno-octulosonate 8-phosphate phosphatase (KDO 8-P phosphatase)
MAAEPVALDSIRLVVLDVDGVLTDGRLYFGDSGEALKAFHVRDGHGIRQIMAKDIHVAVISGRRSAAVASRCRELGIDYVQQGVENKLEAFAECCAHFGIGPRQALCVVDDTTDLALMKASAVAVAVADAHPEVLQAAHRVTQFEGGRGAVREVCDWLLAAQRANQGAQR